MIKLYNNSGGKFHYWETWEVDEKTAIIHWGIVGDKGQSKKLKSNPSSNHEKVVQREYGEKIDNGYVALDENKLLSLEIEYKVDGSKTKANLTKKYDLEDKLDEILGWTGLGHVIDRENGNKTMNVSCQVVDFDIAKNVIEKELKGTKFGDYARIFK